MKNFVQNGRYLTAFGVTPAMDSGEGRVIGGIFGVAVAAIANNGDGVLDTEGVYSLKKAATVEPVQFAPAYWNATAKEVTTDSAFQQIGIFNKAAGAAAATVEVLLDKGLGGKDEMVVSYSKYGAGSLADQVFFIAPEAMKVLKVSAVFSAAEATAGTLTADVTKDTGTQAPAAGVAILGSTKVNLKAAANTVQSPALTGTAANLMLAAGDRLAFKPSAAGTEIANVVVTVHLARA